MSPLEKFIAFYENFNSDKVLIIASVYTDEIQFIDPVKEISSLDELTIYMQNLSKNLELCTFEFSDVNELKAQAYLTWVMTFKNPKFASGKEVKVSGISHIKYNESHIYFHRDYYDLGEMIYEHVFGVSWLIKKIKNKL